MSELPQRKPNRLKRYDYSQNGIYFITICAKDHAKLFGTVGAASCRPTNCPSASPSPHPFVELSEIGSVITREINILNTIYDGVYVDCFIVMPNHVHMLIVLDDNEGSEMDGRQDAAPTMSRIVNQWKRAVSVGVGFSPWQKSFHDHIVRDEQDYLRIAEYIENNPAKWQEDRYYAEDDGCIVSEETE